MLLPLVLEDYWASFVKMERNIGAIKIFKFLMRIAKAKCVIHFTEFFIGRETTHTQTDKVNTRLLMGYGQIIVAFNPQL